MSSSLGANHSQPHRRVAVALGLPVTKIPEAALELVRTVEITGNFLGCNNFLKKVWTQSRYEGNELLREKIFLNVLPKSARIFGIQLRRLTQDFLRALLAEAWRL